VVKKGLRSEFIQTFVESNGVKIEYAMAGGSCVVAEVVRMPRPYYECRPHAAVCFVAVVAKFCHGTQTKKNIA